MRRPWPGEPSSSASSIRADTRATGAFGIGFPPRLGSLTWRGTRYSINAIPLGGFVKMLGEDGEGEAEKMRQRGLSEAAVDRAMVGAFSRKPIWVRVAVLVAGVVMNF